MTSSVQPQLEAPGKGLPLLEKWAARYYYLPKYWKSTSWEEAQAFFEKEGEKILTITLPLSIVQLETPILIHRIQGIEDSSRFWSATLTMEHLMIVGRKMAQAVIALSHGIIPDNRTPIAQVKPKGEVRGQDIRLQFQEFLIEFKKQMNTKVKDRNSRTELPHEWFGSLTARKWHGLVGVHQRIHRVQITHILKGLAENGVN